MASAERYDVTDCNELEFSGAPRSDHATLYVSSSSPWRPSPSREWAAPPAERNAFVALAKAKLAATPPPIPRGSSGSSVCPHGLPEALYFDAPVGGALIHHGVFGGPTGYVIATNDTHGWRVITTMVKSAFECHRPVAVFDMNGDGAPEIVLRFDDAPSWNDYVLERTSAGAWWVAAESPVGGTM